MRVTIAAAALVGSATASYGYGYPPAPPAVNSTSVYETPSETPYETPYETTSVYETPSETPYTPAPSDVYTTKVVTELTTYCPSATEITYGTKTYTVTEETTLTITDCPCTVVETPTHYEPAPPAETPYVPAPPADTYTPAPPAETPYPLPPANGTTYVPAPTGTGAPPPPYTPTPSEFPGAATQVGAGLMAIVAAVAAFL